MSFDLEALAKYEPFSTLSEEYLQRLMDHLELFELERGTLVFKRGKPLAENYYLVSGSVDLIAADFESEVIQAGTERARQPLNLLSPSPVSGVAKEPVVVFRIDKEFLDLVLAYTESTVEKKVEQAGEEHQDWMSCLLESPLFNKVPPANLQELFAKFEWVEFEPGDVLIQEGEQGDYFYVLEKGRVAVESRSQTLDVVLRPGHYFGEEALVGDAVRNASVIAQSSGGVMRLTKEDFRVLLQEPILQFVDAKAWASLEKQGAFKLIDVRLPMEYRCGHVAGAANMPLGGLRGRLDRLETGINYLITGDGGRRAEVAAYLFNQAGLDCSILSCANELY
ncbi:cyclic nucleotide-binding domain-containing protein [Simiduia aestuariiviva]|uniref:CRP-like cAMP-binding protein n=1 Tax=Simiduia aestuariiviva TaxID=1510459 RepID=A0A839UK47_9GAMM|nr:cyclic nucleotide-binding domain-containing protein [Simiduia aestuariiviva]MBB3168484.1 CRP-like cAMP-binding protein [Simiduia aestuariiviva]